MEINRIDAWNKIIEEIDAKTLESADGLTAYELLDMLYKNYKDSFKDFVREHIKELVQTR